MKRNVICEKRVKTTFETIIEIKYYTAFKGIRMLFEYY